MGAIGNRNFSGSMNQGEEGQQRVVVKNLQMTLSPLHPVSLVGESSPLEGEDLSQDQKHLLSLGRDGYTKKVSGCTANSFEMDNL